MSDKNKKKSNTKPVVEKSYCSVLYMLPEETEAAFLAEALPFMKTEAVEVWKAVNVLELSLENGTLTFEDITEDIDSEEDQALLAKLNTKQVYACDYEASDRPSVQKIFKELLARFGGRLASDTEDFTPFLQVEEL